MHTCDVRVESRTSVTQFSATVACSAISDAILLRMSKPFWFRSLHLELQKQMQ